MRGRADVAGPPDQAGKGTFDKGFAEFPGFAVAVSSVSCAVVASPPVIVSFGTEMESERSASSAAGM